MGIDGVCIFCFRHCGGVDIMEAFVLIFYGVFVASLTSL